MDNKQVKQLSKYFIMDGNGVIGQVKATKSEIILLCNALHHVINTPLQVEPVDKNWRIPYKNLLQDYENIKSRMRDYEQEQASSGQN